jgi:hypothetical protein
MSRDIASSGSAGTRPLNLRIRGTFGAGSPAAWASESGRRDSHEAAAHRRGVIGSLYAARLTQAGADVTLPAVAYAWRS